MVAHARRGDLGGEEDRGARQTEFPDGFGAGPFVAVGAGGVDLDRHVDMCNGEGVRAREGVHGGNRL